MHGSTENKLSDWTPERQTSPEATRTWLEAYYTFAEGDLIFVRKHGASWRRHTVASLKDCSLPEIADTVHGKHQLYLKINTMNAAAIIKRSKYAVGGNAEIAEIVSFHADVDCDKRPEYPTRALALERLHTLPIPPSMIVGSGGPHRGGLHPSWLLQDPIPVNRDGAIPLARLKAVSNGFQQFLADALQPFKTDKLKNLERVLRVPGSVRKDGEVVALLELNDRRYTLADIEAVCPVVVDTADDRPATFTSTRSASPSEKSEFGFGYTEAAFWHIMTYLDSLAIPFEEQLRGYGWKLVGEENKQNLWQRPNAPADATPVSARQGESKNKRPGLQNFSGNAGIPADSWYSAEALFVHYRFGGDWGKAASYCDAEMNGERIVIPPPDFESQFTVTQWRQLQAESFHDTIIGLNVERSPMGTGKTAAATKMIAEGAWGSTTFCCASHANCVEVAQTLTAQGIECGLFPTVTSDNCINADEAKRAMSVGLPIVSTVCADCPHNTVDFNGVPSCSYHRQRITAERRPIRIATHARLVFSDIAGSSETVVIDEDALTAIRPLVSLSKDDLVAAKNWWLASGLEQADACAAICDTLLAGIENGGAAHQRVVLPPPTDRSDGWHKVLWADKGAPHKAAATVMRLASGDFADAGACSSNAVAVFGNATFEGKRLVYLDTTASVELLQRAFYQQTISGVDLSAFATPPPIRDLTPTGSVRIAQRPIQIPDLDVTIGKDFEAKAKRLARQVVALIARHDYQRVSVIGHSKHIDQVKKHIPRALHWRLLDFFYFRQGPDRGSNYWHDLKCDCLVVAGTPRVPEDAIRDTLAAFGYWGVAIPKMVACNVTIDGQTFKSRKYPEKAVQLVYEYLVSAPLLQAIGRARPLQSEVKCDTYVFSSAIIPSWYPQIEASGPLDEITDRTIDVAQAVAELADGCRGVSSAAVAQHLGMNERYARKVLQQARTLNLSVQLGERSGYFPSDFWRRKEAPHI